MQKFKAPAVKETLQNLIESIDKESFLALQAAYETAEQLNALLLLAIEGTGYGFWDWDIPNDLAYFSDKFRKLVGYEVTDYTGGMAALAEITHPDDLPGTIDAITAHFEKKAPYFHEYRLKTPSGAYHWFLVMGQAVWDNEGKPIRMAGMLSDISARKQTEEALRSSELRLKHAQEMAQLGSWMYEPDNGTLQWSSELYRIFEMEGTPDKDLYATYRSKIHPDDLPLLNAAIATGKTYHIEFRVLCKNDQIKYVLGVGDFIRDAKMNVLKMVGIGQDITKRKLLENSRLEYQQTLEVLLFTLSHKIRKPVANIQAIAELMDSVDLQTNPVLKEYLGYLNQSNQELDAYIHEMNHLLAEKKRKLS